VFTSHQLTKSPTTLMRTLGASKGTQGELSRSFWAKDAFSRQFVPQNKI
jgi:hypothetical protein